MIVVDALVLYLKVGFAAWAVYAVALFSRLLLRRLLYLCRARRRRAECREFPIARVR